MLHTSPPFLAPQGALNNIKRKKKKRHKEEMMLSEERELWKHANLPKTLPRLCWSAFFLRQTRCLHLKSLNGLFFWAVPFWTPTNFSDGKNFLLSALHCGRKPSPHASFHQATQQLQQVKYTSSQLYLVCLFLWWSPLAPERSELWRASKMSLLLILLENIAQETLFWCGVPGMAYREAVLRSLWKY